MSDAFKKSAQQINANRRIGKTSGRSEEAREPVTTGDLKPYTIRLYSEQKTRLDRYFATKGMPTGVGIRSILVEWMEKRGI